MSQCLYYNCIRTSISMESICFVSPTPRRYSSDWVSRETRQACPFSPSIFATDCVVRLPLTLVCGDNRYSESPIEMTGNSRENSAFVCRTIETGKKGEHLQRQCRPWHPALQSKCFLNLGYDSQIFLNLHAFHISCLVPANKRKSPNNFIWLTFFAQRPEPTKAIFFVYFEHFGGLRKTRHSRNFE